MAAEADLRPSATQGCWALADLARPEYLTRPAEERASVAPAPLFSLNGATQVEVVVSVSDETMGGGRLGANGSHQIDLLRFWFGDLGAISGHVVQ